MLQFFHRFLSAPAVYQRFQRLAGGLDRYARDYVRVRPGERVLDIGCGTGEILNWLDGVDYVGFDLSEKYIRKAKQKYGNRGRFFCESVRPAVAVEMGAFDLVMANGVLHHLTDFEADSLLRLAKNALTPGGRFISIDGCFTPDQSWLSRSIVSLDRGRFVRTEPEYVRLAKQYFPTVKSTVRHDLMSIPFTQVVLQCTTIPKQAAIPA